ncbi:ABC transporter substrate-binding protein [Paeniglutamicibacter terrestris]|uniref:Amino acid ABC transporter substrate-binding protein n=1 Tax=Paeniglutamicibacter terrestris TaxID=2723403 RepID=A0ABX1G631_9MICC|nr:ABC transporter substrate-binding protein [Paeniglutamicibacter terrestris]ASN40389.1 amino acid ABC transporter substrate-binding protein [Arthrobacter sp. 7749]NKG21715.1 amino acid ABC transporter substrate-binding protein [Paeniglutamicibacter terrestris]
MTTLKLACIDAVAPPLFSLMDPNGQRTGYEPAAAELVASRMGRKIDWVTMGWDEMLPAVRDHQVDAVWCGQGIIPERQAVVDFTRPYAVFDETVLVRKGDPARSPADLVGYRVAAIDGSANMALARTFEGAIIVPFSGDTVYEDMLAALADATVDAMVDDDVVLVPLGDDPRYDVAFTVATRNPWGIGVAKDAPFLREELNVALAAVIADGSLEEVWDIWMPTLDFPLQRSLEAIAGSRT